MSVPTLHDLEFFRQALPEIHLSDSWVISTTESDDVIWNVVLAYLNSFPLSDKDELTRRIQCLTGHQEVKKCIKRSIKKFNPFICRDARFCDEELSNLVTEFKGRVEHYIKGDERLLHIAFENFRYLEASSLLLSCNIVLISVPFEDKFLVNVFPALNSANQRKNQKYISLFNSLKSINGKETMQYQFSFYIPKQIGMQKQRHALIEILKRTRVSDIECSFTEIIKLRDITENFFASLVKNDLWRVIHTIYECPDTLLKLANAGLDTDPKKKDEKGKSPFFYALKTEKVYFVSLVYDHVVNPCLETETPGKAIVEILLGLREDFKRLEKDLESKEISNISRCLFSDLYQFNEFQLEMLKNINNIMLKINSCGHIEKECEILRLKETILVITESFDNHERRERRELYKRKRRELYKKEIAGEEKVLYKKKERYVNDTTLLYEYIFSLEEDPCPLFEDCFNKFEFNLAVMFLDNLFLLKERMELPKDACLDIELDVFRFVFLKKFLARYKDKNCYLVSRWIISEERLSLNTNLWELRIILEEMELSKDNGVNKLPEAAVRTLKHMRLIYGQFLIFRLQHYFKAATGITVEDLKSILVIERCLQVLGECCTENDFNSVRIILTSALSKDLIEHLKKILYSLDHFKTNLFQRQILEKDESLFAEIRKELVNVEKLLSPIFTAHNVEMRLFLLEYSSEYVARNAFMEENNCKETDRFFDEMDSCINEEIAALKYKKNILHYKDKDSVSHYEYILQNMISDIREVFKSLKAPNPEKAIKETIKELDNQFWCLENFLAHITSGEKYRRILDFRSSRKFLFEDLDFQFQKKNKPTNLFTDVSPLWKKVNDFNRCRKIYDKNKAEGDEIRKHLSSDSTENWRKRHINLDSIDLLPENVISVKHDSADDRMIQLSIDEIKAAECFLFEYENVTKSLHLMVSDYEIHFENIKNFCLMLEGRIFLTAREKDLILKSMPEKIQINQQIQDLFKEKAKFSNEVEDKNFELCVKNMQIMTEMEGNSNGESKCLFVNSRDYFTNLIKMMEIQGIDESECEFLCKELEIPDNAKEILLKLISTQSKEINKFEFLRNRIKTLKSILIDDNKSIQQLWVKATTSREKMHVKEKIVQLFLNDSVIQASVEMLFSDCKTILRSKDLKQLWKKTMNLFNGINLRNVLIPDTIPQLKSIGRFLNPYDLSSEIVESILKLISDENVLDSMQQILEHSGTDFSNFMQIMDDEKSVKFKNLREQILECEHWEEYALLIPFREVRPL